jgi:hypothetical protein
LAALALSFAFAAAEVGDGVAFTVDVVFVDAVGEDVGSEAAAGTVAATSAASTAAARAAVTAARLDARVAIPVPHPSCLLDRTAATAPRSSW